jgi:hypothetical protein
MKRAHFVRIGLLVVGVTLATFLVRKVGVEKVVEAFRAAGPYLPLIALLEISVAATDTLGARMFAGPAARHVPLLTWLRTTAIVYSSTMLLPAGRATGEAGRAATLAPHIGVGRATGIASRVQAGALYGNAFVSLIAALFVGASMGWDAKLALALFGNVALCGLAGTVVFLLARSTRFAAWLKKRAKKFVESHSPSVGDPPTAAEEARGLLLCISARLVQTTEYAVVVGALGGGFSVAKGFTAQGIHLVAAAVGDVVPGQMGAMEGAFMLFGSALGFAGDPARAITVALVVRVAQVSMVLVTVIVASLVSGARKADAATGQGS